MIEKLKNTEPWTNVISDISGEEIVEICFAKELQKGKSNRF